MKKREFVSFKIFNMICLIILIVLIELVKCYRKIWGSYCEIMERCLRELKYCDIGINSKVGKLNLFIEFFENFFCLIKNKIVNYLFEMFRKFDLIDVKIIFFVGGFLECELV